MTWQFTLTGLLIGVLVGLTGMGGGSLMTPILVIVFGFKPTYAARPRRAALAWWGISVRLANRVTPARTFE